MGKPCQPHYDAAFFRARVRCGCCRKPISQTSGVNLVIIGNRRVRWECPTGENFATGEKHRAMGVVCDRCLQRHAELPAIEVLEFRERVGGFTEVLYHDISECEPIRPAQGASHDG